MHWYFKWVRLNMYHGLLWVNLLAGLLNVALPKMTRLRVLECYGLLLLLCLTISTVDPVVIINNATVIATLAYLTTCCNCNGHN